MIAWSLEPFGPLDTGGGWYFQSVHDMIGTDGDDFTLLDALHTQSNVVGMFSDWPAPVTCYATCMGLRARRGARMVFSDFPLARPFAGAAPFCKAGP